MCTIHACYACDRTLRTVALVSLRAISLGEELLSDYFTIDTH